MTISYKRSLDRYGHLVQPHHCDVIRCDFLALRPYRGHPGFYTFLALDHPFPGYWASTPGTYFWQAEHVANLCDAPGCEVVSPIRTFKVTR